MAPLGSALLYLLALDAVASALLAWDRVAAVGVVAWAIALLVSLALGERLSVSLATIEAKRRDRVAVFLGTIQLSVLVLALVLAAVRPTPELLGFLASVLSGYQLLVLLLLRLTNHPRSVVAHSLALLALAGLRGGVFAAWAAASALGLVGLFIGLDHHSRLLLAHRIDDRPFTGLALRRTAALVLPVAMAVGVVLARLSSEPMALRTPEAIETGPAAEREKREMDTRALRAIVVTGLMGAVAVYFVGRLLMRGRRGEPKAIETPEPLRGRLERLRPKARAETSLPEYPGRRGRIVRAYLNLLRGAERAGFPRRVHETPREFASALAEPAEALRAATEAFSRARYGPSEPTDDDVTAAERGTDAVLDRLQRRPPRRREEFVDSDL